MSDRWHPNTAALCRIPTLGRQCGLTPTRITEKNFGLSLHKIVVFHLEETRVNLFGSSIKSSTHSEVARECGSAKNAELLRWCPTSRLVRDVQKPMKCSAAIL